MNRTSLSSSISSRVLGSACTASGTSAVRRTAPAATFIATLALAVAAARAADADPTAAGGPPGAAEVKPSAGQSAVETFDVQFDGTDVLRALEMLALQSRRNIVASRQVSGTISANLFGVTVDEAIDVILRSNGLAMETKGNFIYVYTAEEWEAISRGRMKKSSRNFSLEYLNPKDASEFIAPLLSEQGKVSFVGDVDKGFQPASTDGGSDSWAFSGMIVVSDFPENVAAIERLLKEIDTPPAQVVVESTIVSSKVRQDDAFGVDVSIIGNLDFGNLIDGPLSGPNDLFSGEVGKTGEGAANAVSTRNSGWSGDSTLRVGVVSDDVAVFLRMLDSVTDTTVLARPRVMALNRQRAQILIGKRVGYLTSTTTQTSTTQSVEFLDSGIKLIFRPFISADGSIRMELAPSLSDAKIESIVDSSGTTLPVPNEDTSEVVTNVRVKSGQTLVLGGLFKEDTIITRRQVPGLGDVPLIGDAFKGYEDSLQRQEIIFLVTPTIVKDSIAKVWTEEAEQFEAAVRIGAREGLLPFSRDTITTSENQKALDALAKGDEKLALFHVENSLRLAHNQPEMVRLREQLRSGRKATESDYERSMFESMLRRSMETGETAPPPMDRAPDFTPPADARGDAGAGRGVAGAPATGGVANARTNASASSGMETLAAESEAQAAVRVAGDSTTGTAGGTTSGSTNGTTNGTTNGSNSGATNIAGSAPLALSGRPASRPTTSANAAIDLGDGFSGDLDAGLASDRASPGFSAIAVPFRGFDWGAWDFRRSLDGAWTHFAAISDDRAQ